MTFVTNPVNPLRVLEPYAWPRGKIVGFLRPGAWALRDGGALGNPRLMRRQDLGDRLSRHVPADPREALFRDRMLGLLGEHDAFEREHFVPGHFTASAFVLSPERDALLLIFHKKLSLWLQPGGHVEPGDPSILAAARREVAEEVGLEDLAVVGDESALFDIDIHPIPARKDEPAHEHFDVRFLFQTASRAFSESDEVAGARWVPLVELADVTSDESVRRAARKIP